MKLLHGDCIDVMRELPDNSIDACITDPPYGLEFMGKEWDKLWDKRADTDYRRKGFGKGVLSAPVYLAGKQAQEWHTQWAKEVLRVLKPGGHLLSFGGSRTYHRMACAIEDAGFEIRDQIMWVYGSGFPKSLNISKVIDKNTTKDGTFITEKLLEWQQNLNKKRVERGISIKEIKVLFNTPMNSGQVAHKFTDKSQPQFLTRKQFELLKPLLGLGEYEEQLFDRIEREIIGQGKSGRTAIFQKDGGMGNFNLTIPATSKAKSWEGYGTALKPAHEPIVLARKPLSEKTVAQNVLKWGVGGLAIDNCRVGTNDKLSIGSNKHEGNTINFGMKDNKEAQQQNPQGRFPSNLIHDGSQEVMDLFPNTKSGSMNSTAKANQYNTYSKMYERKVTNQASEGSTARFFYCAKSSKRERDMGCGDMEPSKGIRSNAPRDNEEIKTKPRTNNHPTVKPLALMKYLVTLITREGQTVLDPFMGSGTTGMACKLTGREFIGIEKEKEYLEIAKKRIDATQKNLL